MWTRFKEKVKAAIDRYVLWREAISIGRPVWMNHKIMQAIRKKKRLWRKVDEKAHRGIQRRR
jgi:hypothetical protein